MKLSTKKIVICSFFAALTAVLAQISIPLPFTPVPINMGPMSVLMCGIILGKNYGALSQIVYVLLGLIGIPVFSGFTGGVGKILGPTGGYIIGYIFTAYVVGLIATKKTNKKLFYPLAMTIGIIVCYILGTAWFMYTTKNPLIASLTMCVFPFLIGDALKIFVGTILCLKIKKIKGI
ncbi:biotin transporter BioY [Sedimentibacter sp. zth1]|uniref:biotin transporter BioY n=1 Tax=Sedimentibacter sp. zth1 TaxID=2816908 RepID=UPI001A9130B6|nr:biotin transporter BioY [Sedimentibacter sp. zth1]QSX04953.1 biotin transporter BioY [Sedimentibacter sp. zth1]